MPAEILPVIARAAGVDPAKAARAFDKAKAQALRRNAGVDDSRAFYLAVEGFRAAYPFDLAALTMDRNADGPDPRPSE